MIHRMIGTGLLVVMLVLVSSRSCGASDLSRDQEKAIGQSVKESMDREYGLYIDPRLIRVTLNVLNQVKRDTRSKWNATDWRVNAVQTDIPNAFAAPGGYLFATSGLLNMLSNDELTGVMAHEIGHSVYRHSWDRLKIMLPVGWAVGKIDNKYAQLGAALLATALGAHYSRADERQADSYGAMYNPYGLIGALRKLESYAKQAASRSSSSSNNLLNLGFLGAFRTHPSTSSRVQAIEAQASGQTPSPIKLAAASSPTPQTTSYVPRVVALEVSSYRASYDLEKIISTHGANISNIKFVVWGQEFEAAARAQDQINHSGRYDRSQPQYPQKGLMTPPSELWRLTFDLWDSEKGKGGGLGYWQGAGLEIGSRTYEVICEITVSPVKIQSGEYLKGGETLRGKADSTEKNFWIKLPNMPGFGYRNQKIDWREVQRAAISRAIGAVLGYISRQNPVDYQATQVKQQREQFRQSQGDLTKKYCFFITPPGVTTKPGDRWRAIDGSNKNIIITIVAVQDAGNGTLRAFFKESPEPPCTVQGRID